MGLDFRVAGNFEYEDPNPHWSYGGFAIFRQRLAKEIGVDLSSMYGFGGTTPWSTVKDDIKYLLCHSDCEGTISPRRCGKIAPRLRDLVAPWEHSGDTHDWYNALYLARLMEICYQNNLRLVFC